MFRYSLSNVVFILTVLPCRAHLHIVTNKHKFDANRALPTASFTEILLFKLKDHFFDKL